jgi:hypothetical protein
MSALCVLFVAGLFIISRGGISVGASNHVGLLPVVRRFLDPGYLPGDFGITLRFYHHRTFVYLVASLSAVLGEGRALVALGVLGKLSLSASLFYLCRVLRIPRAGFLAVGCLLATGALWTGRGLETNTFIGEPEIMPPIFSHSLALLATAALLRGRYGTAAFLSGAAFFFNIQIGLILALVLAPFYLKRVGTRGLKELLRAVSLFLAPASPALLHLLRMMQRGLNGPSFSLRYIDFRLPHHFELLSAGAAAFVAFHLTITAAVYFWLRRTGRLEDSRRAGVLLSMSLALAALSAAHFLDYYLLRDGNVVKAQFPRMSPLITVFGALSLVAWAKTWAEDSSERGRRVVLWANVCLILAASASCVYHNVPLHGGRPAFVKSYAEQRSDWVEVCRWVGENGPREALYLTPPGKEGFTYLSNRSNVAEFKINPDGGQYLEEWFERLSDLSGGPLPDGRGFANEPALNEAYASLGDAQVSALGEKYGASYAVVPARSPLGFETVYENEGYRVVRLPGGRASRAMTPMRTG